MGHDWIQGLYNGTFVGFLQGDGSQIQGDSMRNKMKKIWLVVTGTMEFYDFPFSWEWKIIPTDDSSIIFQRGWWLNHQPVEPFGKRNIFRSLPPGRSPQVKGSEGNLAAAAELKEMSLVQLGQCGDHILAIHPSDFLVMA